MTRTRRSVDVFSTLAISVLSAWLSATARLVNNQLYSSKRKFDINIIEQSIFQDLEFGGGGASQVMGTTSLSLRFLFLPFPSPSFFLYLSSSLPLRSKTP